MKESDVLLLRDLHAIVGNAGLLSGGDVTARSCDPFRAVPPEGPAIVRPASTEELSRVMALCHARGQRVVVHGGRTGVAGGAYAGPDEIVMSLERMARIVEIDPVGLTATVEAGVTLEAVQNAAMEHRLLYPIDLGAKGSATIGGTIATNAGGNRVIRWGMTRQNVLGVEAVLSDGTIVSAMNRLLKNNSGYDLKQLFIGSEGTLGIVSRAVLKLVVQPSTQLAAFLSLPSFQAVLDFLMRARRLQQLSAFEVMWQDYYALVSNHDPTRRLLDAAQPFYVLLELMGFEDGADEAAFHGLLEAAFEAGLIVDAVAATSLKQVGDLWRIREGSEILVREMAPFISLDIGVDSRRADAFVASVRQALADQFRVLKMVTFGHLGDSNLHIGVHTGPDTLAHAHDIEAIVYGMVRQFDGALTAEHGIGQLKRDFLPMHAGIGALTAMRRVRDALDGARILNHDVLF